MPVNHYCSQTYMYIRCRDQLVDGTVFTCTLSTLLRAGYVNIVKKKKKKKKKKNYTLSLPYLFLLKGKLRQKLKFHQL